MQCPNCNQDVPVNAGGLNTNGVIFFVVLLLFCLPLCWLPFIMDSCKKHTCSKCGKELN